ncbi:hypothetical protein DPSP01_011339 [Paraphaeosphaeria sporulosa]|uniref:Uncharacterized protein n=1 Tax=Paraphaeosphaeria sporulosa TaxID=1460663 RepID=A0A177CP87_9PLEO|nr:uncharacterized protein CC84DRAFT_1215176 [Paraphaeosphaeria sporulosa]OAG08700.1 hypothetical protein CC84DRAFT_1215176 [Paraphaeosphaeria sporulosa]
MSDRNSSPFADAIRRSKSFLTKIAPNKSKSRIEDKSITPASAHTVAVTDTAGNNPNYKRRMRVVTDTERRDNPLNLGEAGWGAQSWNAAKQEQKQVKELEELWSEMGSVGRNSSVESVRERVTDPRVFLGQARLSQTSVESRHSRASGLGIQRQGHSRGESSGSPTQYHRPLPFRVSRPRDPPSPTPSQSTRTAEAGALPPVGARVSGSYLSAESAAQVEARLAARAASNNLPRTRVAGPRPNNMVRRSGSYASQGVRVTPGSFGDNEREEYLAKLRARGGDGSDGSRAGHGTRKGVGDSVF